MSKELSIEELGKEYEKHASLQQYFIDKCKLQIKQAKQSGDTDAVKRLQGELYKFREIRNELLETASQLKNYYKYKGVN